MSRPFFACSLFLLSATLISALETSAILANIANTPVLDIKLSGFDTNEIQRFLKKGLRCKLEVTISVMEKSEGLWTIFGDRTRSQTSIVHSAEYDNFMEKYLLFQNTNLLASYSDWDDFLAAFSTMSNISVNIDQSVRSEQYIIVNAKFSRIVLVPPFTILTRFLSQNSETAPQVTLQATAP